MDVKIGDIYIREKDGKICRVKKIDNTMIVLELEDEGKQALTDIFGLERGYTKKEHAQ
ncbi:MAG: hypothetical protein ABSB22_04505 [Thermodesulfobacteriota bacterium]|jgi:hypothetical protein